MFVKICALGAICALVYMLVTQMSGQVAFGVKLGATVLIGGGLIIMAEPLISGLLSLAGEKAGELEYASVVIKATGVAILSHMCADICRDCGHTSAASGVILAAKIEILVLCLPLVERIIGYAGEILNMR